ncbi:ATP-binding cassette domain-containing protein [Streptomyces sp. NPDC086519]|uniref:ATP-binding cassette domain-containing protein n=1 Tax=Streptomyces sp. NPDC086519 TaxID=3154863 RepID=UPI00342DBCB2
MLVELVAPVDMAAWLDAEGIPDGTPFLISPAGEYDTGLNSYGRSPALISSPVNTQPAFARDMKGSGGQKQRAVIAMALALGTRLIVADEPTTALDVTVQAEILEVLHRCRTDFGTAVLLITHNKAWSRISPTGWR